MSGPVLCFGLVHEYGYQGDHCSYCHGDNFFDEDVCHTVKLADGREAEACCNMIRWLYSKGLIDQAASVSLRASSGIALPAYHHDDSRPPQAPPPDARSAPTAAVGVQARRAGAAGPGGAVAGGVHGGAGGAERAAGRGDKTKHDHERWEMMIAIVVSKDDFERAFAFTVLKLELARFQAPDPVANRDPATINEMHRAFHYEITLLKERLMSP